MTRKTRSDKGKKRKPRAVASTVTRVPNPILGKIKGIINKWKIKNNK